MLVRNEAAAKILWFTGIIQEIILNLLHFFISIKLLYMSNEGNQTCPLQHGDTVHYNIVILIQSI